MATPEEIDQEFIRAGSCGATPDGYPDVRCCWPVNHSPPHDWERPEWDRHELGVHAVLLLPATGLALVMELMGLQ